MIHGGDIYSEKIEYDFSVNLNPLDCSAITESIMRESLPKLCNYPDPQQREFRKAVAEAEGVAEDEIFGGSGASEIMLALVAMMKPTKVMLLNPCFIGYRHVLSILNDCEIVEYNLLEENGFMPDEIFLGVLEYEAQRGLNMLFLTNPNNPTGKNIPKSILDKTFEICKKYEVNIIVDECFIRMSGNGFSLKKYINDYHGLFVVNAFTKIFSIPGVRVGYVIADSNSIERLSGHLPEWNLSVVADTAGVICSRYLVEQQWEEQTKAIIEREREYLSKELTHLGYKVYESDTVFILIYSESDIFEYLKSKQILIRDCSNYEGLNNGYYRIAVKSHQENKMLIQTLKMRN